MSVIIGLQMVKNWTKTWEFLEKFWSFGEFLEWFGGVVERPGEVEIG